MRPNILYLSIDSLRQDKCLGKSKTSVTPNLDKLIQNGTFFNQIVSTAPVSMPSLSSVFTGLYPFECTTVDDMRGQKGNLFNLNQNLPTFSDDLSKSGYHTYAIIPEVRGTVANHNEPITIEKITTEFGVIGNIINNIDAIVRPV